MLDDLDAQVRRADEDRWLASRFAPADVRAALIAIYALNHEIARTAEVVSSPQLADIRLAWWRDAIADVYAGKAARSHPALLAFAPVAARVPDHWLSLIEARRSLAPFADWDAVDAFIGRTARPIMEMALAATGADHTASLPTPVLTDLALAWGHIAFARSSDFASRAPGAIAEGMERAEAAYARVRSSGERMPAAAFPAIGYAVLIPSYVRALRRGERDTALLGRQLRLISAAATGRF